jgi:hypothetical protein
MPLQTASIDGLFCDPIQKQSKFQAALFSRDRQSFWSAVRPNSCSDQLLRQERLSGKAEANPILRRNKKQTSGLFNQQFFFTALTITDLFRCRWKIELFFKRIKQHLRIKAFYGNSENAVKTQIWIAISVYVLVAITKKRLNLDLSLYTILQILSVTLFEKTPILQALEIGRIPILEGSDCNQLKLFH